VTAVSQPQPLKYVRRTTALPPKADVHPQSRYVTEWDGPAVLPPYRLTELGWGFRRARGAHHHALQDRRRRCPHDLVEQMRKKGIDYDSIVNVDKSVALDYAKGPRYDEEELLIFKRILITSSLLPLLVALFRTLAN
jgi:hypothetical protein